MSCTKRYWHTANKQVAWCIQLIQSLPQERIIVKLCKFLITTLWDSEFTCFSFYFRAFLISLLFFTVVSTVFRFSDFKCSDSSVACNNSGWNTEMQLLYSLKIKEATKCEIYWTSQGLQWCWWNGNRPSGLIMMTLTKIIFLS